VQSDQRTLIAINVFGGCSVLGSYLWGFLAQPAAMGALWGGVPESARGLYTINMFLAAGGYFLFTPYFVFRLLTVPSIRGQSKPRWISLLYLAILVPSALWLPMTAIVLENPSDALWNLIRLNLGLVAIGSLGLLWTLGKTRAEDRRPGHWLAIVGLLAFNVQTVVLDAIAWPLYFQLPSA